MSLPRCFTRFRDNSRSFVQHCQSIRHQTFKKRGPEILTRGFCNRRLSFHVLSISFRTFIEDEG